MPLSLTEIKTRATAFSHEWQGAKAERAEAQTFWNEMYKIAPPPQNLWVFLDARGENNRVYSAFNGACDVSLIAQWV